MIKIRSLRFLTAMSLIGVAAANVSAGWSVLRFAWAEISRPSGTSADVFGPFVSTPGVASFALRRIAADTAGGVAGAQARLGALTDLLSRKPLDSAAWFKLAETRLAMGDTLERVVGALALSALTGPNESGLMASRALFGWRLWEVLPPASRRNAVVDLTGVWGALYPHERTFLRDEVIRGDDKSREELRALLLVTDPSGARISAELGLEQRPAEKAPDEKPESPGP